MPELAGWIWIALAAGNIPVYVLLGWAIFGDWSGFLESLRLSITSDWISAFRGELIDDWWASVRFFVWLVVCAAAVLGEAYLIDGYLLAGGG